MDRAIRHFFNKTITEKIQLENGWKETWLLTLSDKRKVIFRAHPDYAETFKREQFFYERINKRLGKTCPEVYAVDGTCEYYEKAYQISEYIEGENLGARLQNDFDAQKKKEIYYKIGEITARINQTEIEPDHPYAVTCSAWENYFADKLYSQLNRVVRNDIITADEIDILCNKMRSLHASRTHSFLHLDIRPYNMICQNDKIFVIDAETCEFGDPLNELAHIKLEWNYWELYEELLKGYKSVLDIDTSSELFDYYQLEKLGDILDYHFNYNCRNQATPHYIDVFQKAKDRILHGE